MPEPIVVDAVARDRARASRFDLKRRLSLAIASLLAVVLGLSVIVVVRNAAHSVRGEIDAVMRLANRLVEQDIASGESAARRLATLSVLDGSRHLCVEIEGRSAIAPCPAPMPREVPRWFAHQVLPPLQQWTSQIEREDGSRVVVALRADGGDEVLEAWSEARPLLTAMALIGFLINATVVVIVWLTLRPVDAIRRSITSLSQGQLNPPFPQAATPELAGIVDGLRDLAQRLRLASEEKHRLLRRNLELQESERGAIARELHDELGQGLAVIDANVALLQQREVIDEDTRTTYLLIRDSVAGCYDRLRALLVQLRPAGLSEFGLGVALQSLVGDWSRHCPHIAFESVIDAAAAPDDTLTQTYIYRVAQEALTNAVRHSGARRIRVEFGAAAGEPVCLRITDDGSGMRERRRRSKGYGLAGIRERAEAMGALLDLQSPPSGGTQIELWLPGQAMAASLR